MLTLTGFVITSLTTVINNSTKRLATELNTILKAGIKRQ